MGRMARTLNTLLKNSFLALGLDIKRLDKKFLSLKNAKIFKTVFDVGANTGQFARMIHKVLPEASNYSFAPFKDCYEKLLRNIRRDEDRESEIHRNEFSPSSSILAMGDLHTQAFPYAQRAIRDTIQVRRLDGIAQRTWRAIRHQLFKLDFQPW